jgi:hypothetical protein
MGCCYLNYMAWNGGMNGKLERTWKWFCPNQDTIMAFAWRDRKTMKTLGQGSRCPSWELNWASPEYKSGLLPLDQSVGIEVLTVVVMNSSVFWDITLHSPLKVSWHFGGTCQLRLQGIKINQARHYHEAGSKQRYTPLKQTTKHYIPEGRTLLDHCLVTVRVLCKCIMMAWLRGK